MHSLPSVSLLVAVRNEAEHIEDLIASIKAQEYPADKLEVIILDGGSTDGTREIVKALIKEHANYRLIGNPKTIQSAAWNLGLDVCRGEIISIVSGHVILAPDYVSKAVATLQRTCADMVGGTIRAVSATRVGEAIALAMSHPFGVGGARHRYTEREEETDSVFMGFCHRSVYEEIGVYDEELVRNQDDEFSYRLTKAGGRILCNPEIKSYYHSRSTYQSLWKQYFQYGYYKVRVLQKHPKQMSLRQFVPLGFVLALLLTSLLALFTPWGWFALVGLVGVYTFANLLASFLIAKREGWRYFWPLPLAFATIHLSYGLGFLIGLFKFYNRWNDKKGKVPQVSLD
ncbi:MAG TPA: glycosyltransferase family 2 protein [Anaerolineaceae bacterium]|nr:glycosyltransferase family 2 protein [Anaerolineaceae bacterium]